MYMKPYEKPRLMALSLSGNDMLCGNCSPELINNPDLLDDLMKDFDFSLIFGSSAGGCTMIIPGLESYCKMNLNDMVAFAS